MCSIVGTAHTHHPIVCQFLSRNSFSQTWAQSWWGSRFSCSLSYSCTPRLLCPFLWISLLALQMGFHKTFSQVTGISLLGLPVLSLWADSLFEGALPVTSKTLSHQLCVWERLKVAFQSGILGRPQNFSEETTFSLPYSLGVPLPLGHTKKERG